MIYLLFRGEVDFTKFEFILLHCWLGLVKEDYPLATGITHRINFKFLGSD
jgi:hypothetical protein